MRSKPPPSRAATKSSLVCTRVISQGMPPPTRLSRTSSASSSSSSRSRMRSVSMSTDPPNPLPRSADPTCTPRGRVVDDGPEETEFLHGADEIVEVYRLDDVSVRARVVAPDQVLLLA